MHARVLRFGPSTGELLRGLRVESRQSGTSGRERNGKEMQSRINCGSGQRSKKGRAGHLYNSGMTGIQGCWRFGKFCGFEGLVRADPLL